MLCIGMNHFMSVSGLIFCIPGRNIILGICVGVCVKGMKEKPIEWAIMIARESRVSLILIRGEGRGFVLKKLIESIYKNQNSNERKGEFAKKYWLFQGVVALIATGRPSSFLLKKIPPPLIVWRITSNIPDSDLAKSSTHPYLYPVAPQT